MLSCGELVSDDVIDGDEDERGDSVVVTEDINESDANAVMEFANESVVVIVLEGSTVIVWVRVKRSVRVDVPVYGIVTDMSPVRLTVFQDDTDTELLCDGVLELVVLCVNVWVSRNDTDTPELYDLTGVDEVVLVDEKELVGVVLSVDV